MSRQTIAVVAAIILTLPLLAQNPACAPAWGYGSTNGPDRWAGLNAAWKQCSAGNIQSPITIQSAPQDNTLPLLGQSYPQRDVTVRNTAREIKIEPSGAATITRTTSSGVFTARLEELHFHFPIEHKFNSASAQGEIHFVHKFPNGKSIVLAVMIVAGAENPAMKRIIDAGIPTVCGHRIVTAVPLAQLLPAQLNRYATYLGSLTTPPCDEGVLWIVLNDGIQASQAQINALRQALPSNSRGQQQPWAHRASWRSAP